jgi:hypothetical protein
MDTNYSFTAFDTGRISKVIRVPERLYFFKPQDSDFAYRTPTVEDSRNMQRSMPHLTDIEIRPGDIAVSDYLGVKMALGRLIHRDHNSDESSWFRVEEDVYILLRYDNILFVIRDGSVICLNGNVICKPVKKEVETSLVLPKVEFEKNIKEVLYCGSCNRGYLDNFVVKGCSVGDADGFDQGDIIIHKGHTPKVLNEWHDITRDIELLGGGDQGKLVEELKDSVYLCRKNILGIKHCDS